MDIDLLYREILQKTTVNGKSSMLEKIIYEEIINIIGEINTAFKVIIRGAGEHTEVLLKMIHGLSIDIIAVVDDGLQNTKIMDYDVISKESMKKKVFDVVIISSYSYRNEMKREFDNTNVKIIDIYDELERKEIYIRTPFYYIKKGGYEIVLSYLKKYKYKKTKENLEYVIDAFLEIRDFLSTFQYIDEYIENGYDSEEQYAEVKKELENLLLEVSNQVSRRNGKDIIMYWIDAVAYENIEWLPFISGKMDKMICFKYAYTNTPFTHQTMRSMLCGKFPIDDYEHSSQLIDCENSEVIRYCESNGYEFKHIGNDGVGVISAKYDVSAISDIEFARYISGSIILWETVRRLVLSSKNVFYMAHTGVETHPPCISPHLIEDSIHSYKLREIVNSGQVQISHKYIDNQVEFYSGLLGNNIIKIYMSDHGNHYHFPEYYFSERKLHAFFMVEYDGIVPKEMDRIFSYCNFIYVLKWIIERKDEFLEYALTDYSMIQDTDIFNGKMIKEFIDTGNKEYAMAYRGILTLIDKYVILGNGKEFYFLLPDEENNLVDDIKYKKRIQKLRKICGNNFLDITKYEKFKYSLKLYK